MSSYIFKGNKRIWTPREETETLTSQETTQVYVPNLYQGDEKWNCSLIMHLLRLYGAHRCLWDIHDNDNRNRKLRKAAFVDIASALGEGITSAEVARKINVLRATYRYERKRIKQRMRKGIGAKTKLKWFALADSFLREVPKIGKHRKQSELDESNSDLDNEMVFTIDPGEVLPLQNYCQPTEEESNIEIKKENDENDSEIKKEIMDEDISNANEQSKVKWTDDHSLKLVELLKSHPILWYEDARISNAEGKNEAIESIAQELGIPSARIKSKVKKFIQICREENVKIEKDSNYKPQFRWWNVAETFILEGGERPQELDNFVDANAVLPATPMQHSFEENLGIPINPIPSVSVPSVLAADIEEELFSSSVTSPSTNQTTKLIWNGLTDDLLEGKWSLKHSVKFLRLYGSHRCLWDLTDPDYRSREMRAAAIEDIAATMEHGLDADYVAKKIKIFRITYMQHRKRMLEAVKSGQEPEIQLRWFPLADSFLRPHIGLRSIKEQELEREIAQFDYQYVMANLNLIDPELLNDFRDKISKNSKSICTSNTQLGSEY